MEPGLNTGLYTLAEAASLVEASPGLLRAWFLGNKRQDQLLTTDFRPSFGTNVISFLDLIDVMRVRKLRDAGLSMPLIRRCAKNLHQILGHDHGFSHKGLRERNGKLWLELERESKVLIDLGGKQHAVHKFLEPDLKQIDFTADTLLAKRWHIIPDRVFVDPTVNFGAPTVKDFGVPAHILYSAWHANRRDTSRVAKRFNVSAEAVESANQLARKLHVAVLGQAA